MKIRRWNFFVFISMQKKLYKLFVFCLSKFLNFLFFWKILCFQQTKHSFFFSKINFCIVHFISRELFTSRFLWLGGIFHILIMRKSLLSHRCMIGWKCNLRSDSRKCLTIMKLVLFSAVYYFFAMLKIMLHSS